MDILIVCKSIAQISSTLLAGLPFFWLLCGQIVRNQFKQFNPWILKTCMLLLMAFFLALLIYGVAGYVEISGGAEEAIRSGFSGIELYVESTRVGCLWMLRLTASIVAALLVAALLRNNNSDRFWLVLLSLSGMFIQMSGVFSGHFSGIENNGSWLFIHSFHVLAVSLWVGSLPLWWILVRSAFSNEKLNGDVIGVVEKFSRIVFICVSVIVVSGWMMTNEFIDNEGEMIGTPWGRWLMFKLSLILMALVLGNGVRKNLYLWRLAPRFAVSKAINSVGLEFLVLLLVIICACLMSSAVPAVHDSANWPFPFRVSIDAMWADEEMRKFILAGTLLGFVASCLFLVSHRNNAFVINFGLLFFALIGWGTAVWAMTVESYPDTFKRSIVSYSALSIANGSNLFKENCVSCHGRGGLGDGAAGLKLSVPPADLSAPHSSLHTAGDMYWWIGNGIPKSGMISFGSKLSDIERWDLVNFLRAFSQGFQGRIITSSVVKEGAWLGAPDFYLAEKVESVRQLKDFRGKNCVLLVMAETYGQARKRLSLLRNWFGNNSNVSLVFVSKDGVIDLHEDVFLPQSPMDVFDAYSLLTRTFSQRGDSQKVEHTRPSVEFLIDRHGYIRARWVADEESEGWNNIGFLQKQINVLRFEKNVPPPPDDHIH